MGIGITAPVYGMRQTSISNQLSLMDQESIRPVGGWVSVLSFLGCLTLFVRRQERYPARKSRAVIVPKSSVLGN